MKTNAHLIKKLTFTYHFASIVGLLVFACLQTGIAQNCFNVTFNSDKTTVCKGETITFSVSITKDPLPSCTQYTVQLFKTGENLPFVDNLMNQTNDMYSIPYTVNNEMDDFSVYALITGHDCDTDCDSVLLTQPIAIDLISISAQIISPLPPVIACGNNSISLTATNPLDPMGNYMYAWSVPGGGQPLNGPTLEANIEGTYTVTVTGNTCSDSASVTVTKITQLSINITTNPSNGIFCEGDSIVLSASPGATYQYLWSNGVTQQNIKVNDTGTYTVTVTLANSACTGSKSNTVTKLPKPSLGAHANAYSVKNGGSRTISFNPPNGVSVGWNLLDSVNVSSLTQNSGTGSFTENYTSGAPRAPGKVRYIAQAKYSSGGGCLGETDTIVVTVIPEMTDAPFIPEVVSPNNDGSNDFWNVLFPNDDADNHRVMIYNRGGGKVYENDSMIEAWLPAGCPDGVYYYLITSKDGGQIYKGALTIIGGK